MQSRREFFNRLAMLCGAAAVVPVAAKALNVENLSAAMAQWADRVDRQVLGNYWSVQIRGADGKWIDVKPVTDVQIHVRHDAFTAFPIIPNGRTVSFNFSHDLKPGDLLNW